MTSEVIDWLTKASTISPLIPLVCLIIYWKKQHKQHKILAVSLCLSFVFDVLALILARKYNTNAIALNSYCILAFPAIMWFYHETLNKRSFQYIIRIFTILFLIFAFISAVDQGLNTFNYNTWTVSSILIAITSLFFAADLNLMEHPNFAKNPHHKTNIILNTSLAVYYFIAFAVFASQVYIRSNFTNEDVDYFWSFHNLAHVLKNLGVTIAFYLSAKQSLSILNLQNQK